MFHVGHMLECMEQYKLSALIMKTLFHPPLLFLHINSDIQHMSTTHSPGKCTGAAHFTLRSGRCLRGSGRYQTPLVALVCNFSRGTPFSGWRTGGGGSGGGNRGYGTGHTGTQHTGTQHAGTQHAGTQQQQQQQQRKSNSGNARVLLSHGEVQTLYHEFGHALHSLLSRTEFQHLAGWCVSVIHWCVSVIHACGVLYVLYIVCGVYRVCDVS